MKKPSSKPPLKDADSSISERGRLSSTRRTVLKAIPGLILVPSLATLMSGKVAHAESLQEIGPIPGHWSPTDRARPPVDGPKGQDLWKRADKVLPSFGVFLARSARFTGYNVWPGFIAQAKGCRVQDVDGRSYLDFYCGNGPNLLGYQHPEVEAAARAQTAQGDLMPNFSPVMIEFCERLLAWTAGFDWAVPVKRGSDATELAMRVARVATTRPHIIMFKHFYHGTNKEQSILYEGIPGDAQSHVSRLPWNDVKALDNFSTVNGEKVAAVMLNPIEQGSAVPTVFATPKFIAALERFRRRTGALIILDDVRAGFRMHPKGSHKALGLKPDLLCLGKTLGNGYSVAAVMGTEPLRGGAERLLYTSSYIFSAVCFKAGIVTLDVYERENAFEKMMRAGKRLLSGIKTAARKHGQNISFSGPPTHPTMLYDNDPRGALMERFCHESTKRGALFHPRLPWFLSAAHDDAAIDEGIAIADKAFATMEG
ncbi:aminotransferase class III-fold pyridoxal phosphate-dependent enzyme [bacterium]|nr:aminotransferase class III-fold pyridoxal phosphate-dependent enzyme [bacterium]